MYHLKKQNKRRVKLGERIITYNGERVVPADYNYSENIGKGKVLCSCGSIILFDGYEKHTKNRVCIEYHDIIKTTPKIINHLV